MRIRATVAVAAVILCAASLGSAQDPPPGQFTNYGVGTQSCGTWLAARKQQTDYASMVYLNWVLAWLSAAGYYGADLRHTDSNAVAAWLDKYCRENPLNYIKDAAPSLVDELSKPK
jgi:hypothetical protein